MGNLGKYAFVVILSLLFIPIWGLLLLDAKTANQVSVAVCFLITPFLVIYIKNNTGLLSGKISHFLFLVGPIFYLVGLFMISDKIPQIVTSPILWISSTFITILFIAKKFGWKEWILVGCWAYIFSFHIYPYFQKFNEMGDSEMTGQSQLKLDTVNPLDFQYINSLGDTSQIKIAKPLVLIETWNEKCGPCVKSIKYLEPIIDEFSNDVEHVYLYINAGKKMFATEKIAGFEMIKNKQKILIDIQNMFFHSSGMESYPYFILYDSSGNLLDYFVGYSEKEHGKFENKIREMIQKHQ